jgi:2-dehydro-3-deoxygalactonokinase
LSFETERRYPVTQQDDYILGDWGTSRLRLYLVRNGQIKERRSGPGVASFSTAVRAGTNTMASPLVQSLLELTASWRRPCGAKAVLLAGMAGSRNGIVEVPYASLPVHMDAWARAALSIRGPDIQVTIAAGLQCATTTGGDVMRGEETQVFGAMKLQGELTVGSHLLVLPGTHSKWVAVQDGAIMRFTTAMTGEIFALLRTQSTLLSADASGNDAAIFDEDGFDCGARRAADAGAGLLTELFQTRTAQLLEHRSRDWAQSFLSGLLIGSEIAALSTSYSNATGVLIIGEPQLAGLYERAFAQRGVATTIMDGDACVVAGLQTLHAVQAMQRGESA